jgi:hypothetical protein
MATGNNYATTMLRVVLGLIFFVTAPKDAGLVRWILV